MTVEELTINLQSLVTLSEHGALPIILNKATESGEAFTIIENELLYLGKNEEERKQIMMKITLACDKLRIRGSIQNFIKEIQKYILQCKKGKSGASHEEVETLVSKFRSLPYKNYFILEPIWGIKSNSGHPLDLGDFTIYHQVFHRQNLRELGNTFDGIQANLFWDHLKSTHIIGILVMASDLQEAKTQARQRFDDFECLVLFLLGADARKYQIHIGPDQPDDANAQLIYTDDKVTSSFIADFGHKPYDIEQLKDECITFWQTMPKQNKSDIEKRIFNAAIWIGKAIKDPDRRRSFFQLIIALENHFQYDPKEHVRAGITQQLAEYIGFILGHNTEERMEMYRKVKELYRLRSDLVHGRIVEINMAIWQQTLEIARECADWCFQHRAQYNSIRAIHKWIEESKFSLPDDKIQSAEEE